jgi:3-oxoacyl-[acyl-carrier protein] reductase
MIDMNLAGRVALVTGGRRGIGGAIVQRLSAAGAKVVIGAETMQDGNLGAMLGAVRSRGGMAEALAFDLAEPEARLGIIARAAEFFGPIDILVNNATTNNYQAPSMMAAAFRRRMFQINLHGPIDLIQQALPGMKERGWGRLLAISSATTMQPPIPYPGPPQSVHGVAVYGASKAAMDRYTQGLAAELHGTGVTANCVCPQHVCVTEQNSPAALAALRQHPEWAEAREMMAEAALLLIAGPLTGCIMSSRDVLFMLQAPLHSLDAKVIIGDAHSIPELG